MNFYRLPRDRTAASKRTASLKFGAFYLVANKSLYQSKHSLLNPCVNNPFFPFSLWKLRQNDSHVNKIDISYKYKEKNTEQENSGRNGWSAGQSVVKDSETGFCPADPWQMQRGLRNQRGSRQAEPSCSTTEEKYCNRNKGRKLWQHKGKRPC